LFYLPAVHEDEAKAGANLVITSFRLQYMRNIIPTPILLIPVLVVLTAFDSEIKLSRVKVTDEISVMLPRDFRPMDDLDLLQRYPSVRRPIAAFTNPERLVDYSINISASQWPDANLDMAQKFFKASLMNMFDSVDLLDEGIQEVHDKRFIFFEFESRVRGQARSLGNQDPVLNYTYIQYLVEPGRTLVFSFTCPRRLRMDWQETAQKMMKSVKIK
jgi:hypothetical protein